MESFTFLCSENDPKKLIISTMASNSLWKLFMRTTIDHQQAFKTKIHHHIDTAVEFEVLAAEEL